MHERTRAIAAGLNKHAMLLLILLGIAVRVVGFPHVPSGINQDEAITAYNAFTLLHEGVEPYEGYTAPVNLLSWHVGSAVAAGVAMIPSIWLFGMSPLGIRLPFLIAGCISLPLFYLFLRRLFSKRVAVFGLFLLAISPWHISISRWALDGNLLPAFLLAGGLLLAYAENTIMLFSASVLLGLSVYAYGPGCLVSPLLFCITLPFLIRKKEQLPGAIGAILLYLFIVTPMALYVLMNTQILPFETLHFGPITIPRLYAPSRFMTEGFFHSQTWLQTLGRNFWQELSLLLTQDDGTIYNTLPSFGVMYGPGMIASFAGVFALFWGMRSNLNKPRIILVVWLIASLAVGATLSVNVNRFNAIWLPLIACGGIGLDLLCRYPRILQVAIAYFLLWFIAFLHAYFIGYRENIARSFQADIYGAIHAVHRLVPRGPLCITDQARGVNVYVLAAGEVPSPEFRLALKENTEMKSIGRYTIGLSSCDPNVQGYVVTQNEFRYFHGMGENVRVESFGDYVAVTPK